MSTITRDIVTRSVHDKSSTWWRSAGRGPGNARSRSARTKNVPGWPSRNGTAPTSSAGPSKLDAQTIALRANIALNGMDEYSFVNGSCPDFCGNWLLPASDLKHGSRLGPRINDLASVHTGVSPLRRLAAAARPRPQPSRATRRSGASGSGRSGSTHTARVPPPACPSPELAMEPLEGVGGLPTLPLTRGEAVKGEQFLPRFLQALSAARADSAIPPPAPPLAAALGALPRWRPPSRS